MWLRILRHPFLVVFLFALITHSVLGAFLYTRGYQDQVMTDGSQYMLLAENWLAGRGFSGHVDPPYIPDTIRTPLYPLFLAASKFFTGSFVPSLIGGVVLGATIPLAGMMLLLLLGRRRPQELLFVGLFLSAEPHLFVYSLIYGSEAVFLPFIAWAIVASCLLVIRPKLWIAALAGGLFGVAVLGRPIVQFFPFIVVFFLVLNWWSDAATRRKIWKPAIIFVIAYACIVTPWLARNVQLFGAFDFSNVGWFNMYTRVAATTYAIHEHREYDPVRVEFLQRLHEKGYTQKTPVTELDVHGFEWKPIFQKETLAVITQYPKEFLISQLSSFFTVISQDLTSVYLRNMGFIRYTYPSFAPLVKLSQEGFVATFVAIWNILSVPLLISIFGRIFWLILFLLSLWAVVVTRKQNRSVFFVVLLLVIYELYIVALSLNAAAQSDARYRAQFIFVEVPLALIAVISIWQSRRAKLLLNKKACRSCPVCSSHTEVRPWMKKQSYQFCKCNMCGARFVTELPSEEVITDFYSEQYFFGGGALGGYVDYDADKQAARESLEEFVRHIDRHTGVRGRLLDIGAATGIFLEIAKANGWNPFGHEVSVAAAKRALLRGIPMTTGALSATTYEAGVFDAITMLDVIEHVPDPAEVLRTSVTYLRTEGVVLLNTPDSGSWYARCLGKWWHAYNPPEHLTIFNARSLIHLCERAGLEVVWTGHVRKSFRLSYVLHTLSHWTRMRIFSSIASQVERRPALNRALPLNLRDNIVVVARKRC